MSEYDFQPVIVIGAARSGTKLVRDLVAEHPSIDKVPYDINYVWRLGNEDIPHDELLVEKLTPYIRQRIIRHFRPSKSQAPFLIEKTVSNCLRIPFVNAVFPDARFIHLVRDGCDVVESVYRQWQAPTDWRYAFQKAQTFPIWQAPGYAIDYAKKTISKLFFRNSHVVGTWGARYVGIDEDVANLELLEVCAIQWARSVEKAMQDLNNLPRERVLLIRYEEFVKSPRQYLKAIAQFLGVDSLPYEVKDHLAQKVSKDNIGKGFRNLSADDQALVLRHIESTLALLDYSQPVET